MFRILYFTVLVVCIVCHAVVEGGYENKVGKISNSGNELKTTKRIIARDEKLGDNITWTLKDGVLTIKGTGKMFDFTYHENFCKNNNGDPPKRLVIEDGVTSIGKYAFSSCAGLINVSIPNSVNFIGSYAFDNCINLQNIIIPNSVTSTGDWAFYGCESLTSVTIPTSFTSIADYAFHSCKKLINVTIPNSVTSIGDFSFNSCESLKYVTIPSTVTSIGKGAFGFCHSLINMTIPDGVKSIGDFTFVECYNLANVSIPDTVTSIGDRAFEDCSSLTHVTIPDSVTFIAADAFDRCKELSSIFYYGNNTFTTNPFSKCTSLKNVCVPPDYNNTEIGGITVTSDTDTCKSFQQLDNHCYYSEYNDNGSFIMRKRNKAIEWEKQSNECIERRCINETGFVSWSMCNSTNETNRVCVNNEQCVEKKNVKKPYIEVDVDDSLKILDVNLTTTTDTISLLCNVSSSGITVGYESDDDGNIIRIIIYVDDEDTANIVADILDNAC